MVICSSRSLSLALLARTVFLPSLFFPSCCSSVVVTWSVVHLIFVLVLLVSSFVSLPVGLVVVLFLCLALLVCLALFLTLVSLVLLPLRQHHDHRSHRHHHHYLQLHPL